MRAGPDPWPHPGRAAVLDTTPVRGNVIRRPGRTGWPARPSPGASRRLATGYGRWLWNSIPACLVRPSPAPDWDDFTPASTAGLLLHSQLTHPPPQPHPVPKPAPPLDCSREIAIRNSPSGRMPSRLTGSPPQLARQKRIGRPQWPNT